METFGTRLHRASAERGPLCVGIDPHSSLLVEWGVGDDLDGLRRFTDTVVEALAGHVAVLKPQLAFYERHGARGVAVLVEPMSPRLASSRTCAPAARIRGTASSRTATPRAPCRS